jgi:alpha-mannosidase
MILRGESTVGPSKLTTSVAMYADRARIDWLVDVDWREFGDPKTGVPGLKMHFPLPHLTEPQAWFGQSMGMIERMIPSRDVPAQGWTAVVGKEGVAVVYHPTRYGVSVADDGIRVTLLRASSDPDPYAEVGRHQIPLSFEWITSGFDPDQCTRNALARLSPIQGHVGQRHPGHLPSKADTVALSSPVGVVTAIKADSNQTNVILRVRHNRTDASSVSFRVPSSVEAVEPLTVLEQPTADRSLSLEESRLTLAVPAFGLATVRLRCRK